MAVISNMDLAARLDGAALDIPNPKGKTTACAKLMAAGLSIAIAGCSINPLVENNEPFVANELTKGEYQLVNNGFADKMTKALVDIQGNSAEFENDFLQITDWTSAQKAVELSKDMPIMLSSDLPAVGMVLLSNSSTLENIPKETLHAHLKDQLESIEGLHNSVLTKHLDTLPDSISTLAYSMSEKTKGGLSTFGFKVPTIDEKVFHVGLMQVGDKTEPAAQYYPANYPERVKEYSGNLVDMKLVNTLTDKERISNMKVLTTVHEYSHKFLHLAPDAAAFENKVADLFNANDLDDVDSYVAQYQQEHGFVQKLTTETTADCVALILAAKQLSSAEWEGVKYDLLSMRNDQHHVNSDAPSLNAMAHSTSYALEPLIEFLEKYRANPEMFPKFTANIKDVNSTATFVTALIAEAQAKAPESMQDMMASGYGAQTITQFLHDDFKVVIEELLEQVETREELLDMTSEIQNAYKLSM